MSAAHDTQALAERAFLALIEEMPGELSVKQMPALTRFLALASRLQEKEGQPALSERTPKDYAIEHAEYMAAAAERLSDAVNLLAVAHRDEHDDPDIEKAQEAVDESLRAVRDRVYEFRKRRDRATLAAGSQAVQVPGWKLVPVEPTEAMREAGREFGECGISANAVFAYRAMVQAAPLQPLAGGEATK